MGLKLLVQAKMASVLFLILALKGDLELVSLIEPVRALKSNIICCIFILCSVRRMRSRVKRLTMQHVGGIWNDHIFRETHKFFQRQEDSFITMVVSQ